MTCAFRVGNIHVGEHSTRYLDAGSGPALVLLHGTGGHLEVYARNIADLSKTHRVIAYDMLGHGYTAKPDLPYTIDVLSQHLLGLLDALGIARADLSGESLGGWVAAWTAARSPERVRRLVLNTPGNILAKPEVMAKIRESSLAAVRQPSLASVRSRLEWLFLDKSLVTEEMVSVRHEIYTQPGFQRAMDNILVLQDPEVRRRFTWDAEWVGRIEAPSLVLWTTDDPTGDLDEADLLLSWLRDGRLEVIEDAGHWPQWEKPAEFVEAHLRFLDQPLAEVAR